MLVECHDDGGNLFAGIVIELLFVGNVLERRSLRFHLVALRDAFAYLADDVEAYAEQQQRREHDTHGHDGHGESVLVLSGKRLNLVV